MNTQLLKRKLYMDRFLRANDLPLDHFIRDYLSNDNEYNIIAPIDLIWGHNKKSKVYYTRANKGLKTFTFIIKYKGSEFWEVPIGDTCTLESKHINRCTQKHKSIKEAKEAAQSLLDDYTMSFVDFMLDKCIV